MEELAGLEWPVLVLLGLVVLVEIALMVAAVVDLVRRPGAMSGEKLVWLLVSIFVNLLGPLAYFAIGRPRLIAAAGPGADAAPAATARAREAVDALYGVGDSETPPPPNPGNGS